MSSGIPIGVVGDVQIEQAIGVDIVRRAIEAPIRQIAENAGLDGAVIAEQVKSAKGSSGFNALTGEHVDMEIIDLQRQKIVKTRMHSLPTIAHSLTPDRDYFSFLLRGGR